MKILVSSKYLAKKLSEFEANDEIANMHFAAINGNSLILKSYGKSVSMDVENVGKGECIVDISSRRFDFLLDNLRKLDEQPLCLEFNSRWISMYFQF